MRSIEGGKSRVEERPNEPGLSYIIRVLEAMVSKIVMDSKTDVEISIS